MAASNFAILVEVFCIYSEVQFFQLFAFEETYKERILQLWNHTKMFLSVRIPVPTPHTMFKEFTEKLKIIVSQARQDPVLFLFF